MTTTHHDIKTERGSVHVTQRSDGRVFLDVFAGGQFQLSELTRDEAAELAEALTAYPPRYVPAPGEAFVLLTGSSNESTFMRLRSPAGTRTAVWLVDRRMNMRESEGALCTISFRDTGKSQFRPATKEDLS